MAFPQELTNRAVLGFAVDGLRHHQPGRRSINRTTAALGALIAGLLVGLIGVSSMLIGVTIAFAAAALTAALSPLREAPHRD